MSYFAKVENGIVTKVIVAESSFFNTFVDDSAGSWIETSVTGHIRKNYAGVGYSYDKTRDAFIPPKPYASWTLNNTTCLWESPVSYPSDGKNYNWDESSTKWVEVV